MTAPTAGRWIHDRAQLDALPAGSLVSDRYGDDQRLSDDPDRPYWYAPGDEISTSTENIPLPAYVWRVGPAPEWGSREIVDGEMDTPTKELTTGDRL